MKLLVLSLKNNLLLLFILGFIISFPSKTLAAKRVVSLNLEEREIYGSIIDPKKNIIVIPNAKKLGLSSEIRIRPEEEASLDKNTIVIPGEFNEYGEMLVNLTKLGLDKLSTTKKYVIGTHSGRKKFITQFTYKAPLILKGILEVPAISVNSEESKNEDIQLAIITVHDPVTHKIIEEIKPIATSGNLITVKNKDKSLSKNIYKIFAEVPINTFKKHSTLEIKAHLKSYSTLGTKDITLGTIVKIDSLKNNLVGNIVINPATTTALNIINATIDQMKEVIGKDVVIPSVLESFYPVVSLLEDINNAATIDETIVVSKKILKLQSTKLFGLLLAFVQKSPSITDSTTASNITVNVGINPSFISKEGENSYLSNLDIYYLDEIPLLSASNNEQI